jgi:hypothetical protein
MVHRPQWYREHKYLQKYSNPTGFKRFEILNIDIGMAPTKDDVSTTLL